jgi:hypothetical protein
MFFSVARRRRLVVAAAMSGLMLAGIGVLASAASAHDVTGVTATCSTVTVHFVDFPVAGVPVHINVQVGVEPAIVDDVTVNSTTTDVSIDISAATAGLGGVATPVDVDVTWTNYGPQHVHETTSVTCGSATTTTSTTIESSTTLATTSTTEATTTTTRATTTTTRSTTTTMPPTTTTTIPSRVGTQIFQVEFRACHLLHIGYQQLPGGTVVHYSVKQNGTYFAGGNIVTQAGKGYHFTTVSLGKNFTARKADVHFFWKINGVLYTYFARRATDC